MNKTIASIILLLLSANVLAKPAPTGGKACETFNSFYNDSLGGILAKSTDFTSTDAEFASSLARGGFEANQIKYRIAVRNNCRAHVEAMEKQYENKSANQKNIKQKDSEPPGPPFIDSQSNSDATVVSSEGWKLISNWRKLTRGMVPGDVRNILGEPQTINGGKIAKWEYPNDGTVYFYNGEVDRWREPRD